MNGAHAFDDFAFNGIDAITGEYLWPRIGIDRLIQLLGGREEKPGVNEALLADLSERVKRDRDPKIALRRGDARDLSQTGWAVIFASDSDPDVVSALRPLLDHRRSQATTKNGKSHFYQEFCGDRGHQRGDGKVEFLERLKVPPHSDADPDRLPYYLLIVGDPERIPFQFQYEMDVEYAVGRISFESVEEYRRYAETIIRSETLPRGQPVRGLFFGPSSERDEATRLSSEQLVAPLVLSMKRIFGANIQDFLGSEATKSCMLDALGIDRPAFLFSATHGLGFPSTDRRLFSKQGALLCADWPGPSYRGELSPDWYLSADDLSDSVDLTGMITFHFACYGAGTPAYNDFPKDDFSKVLPQRISPVAFVAALSKRLLSRGVLATIGHVERAWTCSFVSGNGTPQLAAFEDACRYILEGWPVGAAMEPFNRRFASLAVRLSDLLTRNPRDDNRAVLTLIDHNDARNYVIIGDPAARIS